MSPTRRLLAGWLRARPLRSLSVLAAIALATAMLLGVQLTLAAMGAAAAQVADARAGGSALDVRVDTGTGLGSAQLTAISRLPGVSHAVPLLEKQVVVPAGGGTAARTITVVSVDQGEAALRTLIVVTGRLPRSGAAQEVALDAGLAAVVAPPGHTVGVGQTVRVLGADGAAPFKVVGITAGTAAGPAFTQTAAFVDSAAMRGPLRLGVRMPLVAIQLAPGASAQQVSAEVRDVLGAVTVYDPRAGGAEPLADLRPLLALVTLLVLLVAAGVAATSASLAVTERRRELGLLRAAGAPASLVFRLLLAETALLALAAAPLGVAGGVLLARLLAAPPAQPVLGAGELLAAVAGGTAAALLGAALPAASASGASILSALRARQPAARPGAVRALAAAGAVALLTAGVLFTMASPVAAAAGTALVLLGVALALPLLLPIVARTLTLVAPRGRTLPLLRYRMHGTRTGLAASGVVASIAGTIAVAVLTTAAVNAGDSWVTRLFPGSVLVHSPVTQRDAVLAALEGSAANGATPIRFLSADVEGSPMSIAAIDPATFTAGGTLDIVSPDRASALRELNGQLSAIVPMARAAAAGWQPGMSLRVQTAAGVTPITIAGVALHAFPGGDGGEGIIVSRRTATRAFGAQAAGFDDLVVGGASLASVQNAVAPYGMQASDVASIRAAASDALQQSIGVLSGVAVIAVVVSALAIMNTLVLNVRLGARELALLRASGMSRAHALRVSLGESLLVAAVAGCLGLGCGCLIALPLLRGSSSSGFALSFVLPAAPVIALCAAVAAAVVVATITPARRSVRTPILQALAHQ